MKMTKKEFKYFTIMDYEQEGEYLSNMRKNGWKVRKVSFPGIYTFEECEPEDVVYQLDYNQEGLKQSAEYIQMFEDCGWEHVFDFVGYSYFCKPRTEMEDQEEIFCDDESRMDMVTRVFKGRIIPLIVIFFAMIYTNLLSGPNPVRPLVIFVFVLYIFVFSLFGYRYYKLRKRMRK